MKRMLTKADIKFTRSLNEKSNRYANKLFVAEGTKSVHELLRSKIEVTRVYANESWLNTNAHTVGKNTDLLAVSDKDLDAMSNLQSTRNVIALCKIPDARFDPATLQGLTLALDTLQDPGNLGTLIRVADWYGVKHILCSNETVDCYNPKVIQATMGSISRVQVFYGHLTEWLPMVAQPVIAAHTNGQSAHAFSFPKNMILVIGNEGTGISPEVSQLVTQTLCIPGSGNTESLNAAIAASILMDRYAGLHLQGLARVLS